MDMRCIGNACHAQWTKEIARYRTMLKEARELVLDLRAQLKDTASRDYHRGYQAGYRAGQRSQRKEGAQDG